MQSQRIPGAQPDDDPTHLQQALLDLLIHDHPGLWSLPELTRALVPGGPPATTEHRSVAEEPSAADVEDAIASLYAVGLIHRNGTFVFATRAAHAAQRLAG